MIEGILEKRQLCLQAKGSKGIFESYITELDRLPESFYEIVYSLLLETNVIEMATPEYIYDNYYIQKKRILEKIALSFYKGNGTDKKIHKKKKRIAICTNAWKDSFYSIGNVIATLANEFRNQGCEVAIFIENQYIHDKQIERLLQQSLNEDSYNYAEEHRQMLLSEINICYNYGQSIRERMIHHIDSILKYAPECILDLTDENSCCSRILYEYIPLIYFPMRSNHGSSMFFHKYLAVDMKKMKLINQKYHCFDDSMLEPIVGGITNFPVAKKIYEKKELVGEMQAFVLVTVGNRLQHDLDTEFIDFIIGFLQRNSMFIWVIVGKEMPILLEKNREAYHLQRQIIFRGFEQDLAALYKICDVYVNPNRKGGGLSIAWAMKEGLPIVMQRYDSDGLSWIGDENGIVGNYEDVGEFIIKLYTDTEYYSYISKIMKQKAEDRTPERCVKQIIEIMRNLEGTE